MVLMGSGCLRHLHVRWCVRWVGQRVYLACKKIRAPLYFTITERPGTNHQSTGCAPTAKAAHAVRLLHRAEFPRTHSRARRRRPARTRPMDQPRASSRGKRARRARGPGQRLEATPGGLSDLHSVLVAPLLDDPHHVFHLRIAGIPHHGQHVPEIFPLLFARHYLLEHTDAPAKVESGPGAGDRGSGRGQSWRSVAGGGWWVVGWVFGGRWSGTRS